MLCPRRNSIKQGQGAVQVPCSTGNSLSAQFVSCCVFVMRMWYFMSGRSYFTMPSLSSWFIANIDVLRHGCFIVEFSAGLLLDFSNEFQPAYLFIYLF